MSDNMYEKARAGANEAFDESRDASSNVDKYESIEADDLVESARLSEQMGREPNSAPRDKQSDNAGNFSISFEPEDNSFSADNEEVVDEAKAVKAEAKADKTESKRPEAKSNEAKSGKAKPKDNKNKNTETSAESQSDNQSERPKQKKKQKRQQSQQKQQKFKVVGQNDNGSPFSASGEFTEEQLVKMYRQMQADRARTQQLFNHVTSPYAMHGSAGESLAMAAGAFMGFALGRTMYKASRIGHLRQDWRLRREVLRQERGYYNQGTQSRFGGIREGFSNAASSFVQGWRRGRRTDINMDVQQPSEKVEVKAAEETAEDEPMVEPEAAC